MGFVNDGIQFEKNRVVILKDLQEVLVDYNLFYGKFVKLR